MTVFQRQLGELLKREGYSARKLSIELGLAPGTVHRYLKDGVEPSIGVLSRICDIFKIKSDDLLSGKESPAPEPVIETTGKASPYAAIPYSHEAAAGEFRLARLEDEDPVIIHRGLLDGASEKNCHAFRIRGKSMEPVLYDGDIVVCAAIEDLDAVKEKNLYCVHDPCERGVTVKKVHHDVENKTLVLRPLNPDSPLQTLRLKKSERHPIIGRVICAWRLF